MQSETQQNSWFRLPSRYVKIGGLGHYRKSSESAFKTSRDTFRSNFRVARG
jgi:hypothetical protein